MSVAPSQQHGSLPPLVTCPRQNALPNQEIDDVTNLGPGHLNVTRKSSRNRSVVLAVPISFYFLTPKPS
jgi:hypothetical protein